MTTKVITKNVLVDMVISGAVYCTNGDAAHTSDYIDDRDELIKTIQEKGFRELDPNGADFDEYADALARLDMFDSCVAHIFQAGAYTFAPDALRD